MIIREFETLHYKRYQRRRPKYDPTDNYCYLARQLAKRTMRTDSLNQHIYPVRMEMAGTKQIPISYVCSTDESES